MTSSPPSEVAPPVAEYEAAPVLPPVAPDPVAEAAPVLPPWGIGLMAGPLRALGLRIPDEMLNQLRFGRGVDNRRLKASGFRYGYTSRESVARLGEHMRVQPVMRGVEKTYTYEREVEEFLRWSPHVRREGGAEGEGVDADREPLGI